MNRILGWLDDDRVLAEAHAHGPAWAAALARLTPKQRTVLVLRCYEDLTEQQTAAVLGVRLGTVKSATCDALHRLRQVASELVATSSEPLDV